MKRFLILLLSIFVTCGPSEAEIQERINQAVEESLSTTTSTTTTLAPTTTTTSTTTTLAPTTTTTLAPTTTTTLAPTTTTTTTTTTTSTTTTLAPTTTTTIYIDNEPPTWPDKTVTISNLNPTYFEVQWKPASDNTNVAGYRFYLDNIFKGEYIRNNDNNSIFLDGLTGGTTYTLEIIAYDNDSNISTDNPSLSITTSTPTTTTLANNCVENPDEDNRNQPSCPKYYIDNEYDGVLIDDANEGNLDLSYSLFCFNNNTVISGGWFFQSGEKSIQPQESGISDDGKAYYIRIPTISQSTFDSELQSWTDSGYTLGGCLDLCNLQ